jgi:hypothetical protein
MINDTSPLKVGTIRDSSDFPDVYIGRVTLPSGHTISTQRMRTSRTSARRDATRLAHSLLEDPDCPICG